MARFYGNVGFSETIELSPGMFKSIISPRPYYGTVPSLRTGWQAQNNSVNDNQSLNVQITINADHYALNNFDNIKWVFYMGKKRKVTQAIPKRPHVELTIGGVWNENQIGISEQTSVNP